MCKKSVPEMKRLGSDMVHIQCKETCIILSFRVWYVFAPNHVEIFEMLYTWNVQDMPVNNLCSNDMSEFCIICIRYHMGVISENETGGHKLQLMIQEKTSRKGLEKVC